MANRLLTAVLLGKKRGYRKPGLKLEKLGTDYGGWIVPVDRINANTVCYSGGVGEDISFDLALIERFHCNVFAFDPTPRAVSFVENNAPSENFRFFPWGLWDEETTLKFFEPADLEHVSHSVVNLQGTETFFEATCKPVSKIAREFGHESVDLVKLNIEGAEFAVLDDIVRHKLVPDIMCVQFDQPCSGFRISRAVKELHASGLEIAAIDGWNFTLVRNTQTK